MSTSSAGIKRKRVCLSIATKLQIVERFENGESISKLATEYNIGNQTVRDMIRKKDNLYKFVITSNTLNVAGGRKTIKGSKFDDLDKAVFRWFRQERAEGRPVTGPVLLEKAKWLHREMNIHEPFAASQGWLQCFKTRHGIKQWDIQGDSSATALYVTEFNKLLQSHDLTPDQLYNAGDIALYWKALPPKTIISQFGLGMKANNERITLLACSNITGSHKLQLVCIGKSKNPRSFRETHMCHYPVIYYSQTKAQMSWDILKDWFFKHFVPEVQGYLGSRNLSQKAVLILRYGLNYPKENELRSSDGQIYGAFLFQNGVFLRQPMDHGLHELKRHYRKTFLRSILEDPDIRNPNLKWTVKNAILLCLKCWEELSISIIQKSWRLVFPNSIKNIKIDDSSSDCSGEIQEITATWLWENVHSIRGFENVRKEDIEEWLLSDSDDDYEEDEEEKGDYDDYDDNYDDESRYKMEENAVFTAREDLPSDNFAQVEEKLAQRKVSITEALNCVETLLDFLNEEPDSDINQILSLRELRRSLNLKLGNSTEQHHPSIFFQELK